MVKLRLMLEKLRPLENRLKYQMDKLLRAAADAEKEVMLGRAAPASDVNGKSRSKRRTGDDDDDASDDDLAFRPNPSAFMQDKARALSKPSKSNDHRSRSNRGLRFRLGRSGRQDRRVPSSQARAHVVRSRRALQQEGSTLRRQAFVHHTQLGASVRPHRQHVRKPKDARKRRRDEADVALGGAGLSSGRDGRRRIGGGMEEEFGDLLRGAGLDGRNGKKAKKAQQAYDTLRASSKAGSTLQRSKSSSAPSPVPQGAKSNKFRSQVNRQARR
ncbi:hypothetical protein L1887_50721 [Cichorium endivia]|nr:hypothetical protein L1887_50721 [Cichorium endivia]